eukprot:CAMPEP_0206047888 /NCGR_PEP_ID=MMETSP1466-20131121/22578_1 /ASSEMBLY_ACC=CAM_ASM_001126 /TAXON_ID=44452 /ORGANISM="Pavlova gyrans, Strain CCMP608" /LENGTH=212 /DNA_ID=CAMNT_0053422915 /DNA_START=65 /DNA_END=700 /DNA_ORIENTATION=-
MVGAMQQLVSQDARLRQYSRASASEDSSTAVIPPLAGCNWHQVGRLHVRVLARASELHRRRDGGGAADPRRGAACRAVRVRAAASPAAPPAKHAAEDAPGGAVSSAEDPASMPPGVCEGDCDPGGRGMIADGATRAGPTLTLSPPPGRMREKKPAPPPPSSPPPSPSPADLPARPPREKNPPPRAGVSSAPGGPSDGGAGLPRMRAMKPPRA